MANPFSLLPQARKSERLTAEEEKDIARAIRKAEDAARQAILGHPVAEPILKRRPDDWDGTLPKFKDAKGNEYELPTLIARDGVHPSNSKAHQDFSDDSLSKNGFALRNYLTVIAYADVIRQVLRAERKKGD